jgi:HEAT repeat protein
MLLDLAIVRRLIETEFATVKHPLDAANAVPMAGIAGLTDALLAFLAIDCPEPDLQNLNSRFLAAFTEFNDARPFDAATKSRAIDALATGLEAYLKKIAYFHFGPAAPQWRLTLGKIIKGGGLFNYQPDLQHDAADKSYWLGRSVRETVIKLAYDMRNQGAHRAPLRDPADSITSFRTVVAAYLFITTDCLLTIQPLTADATLRSSLRRMLAQKAANYTLTGGLLEPMELAGLFRFRRQEKPGSEEQRVIFDSILGGQGPGWVWMKGLDIAELRSSLRGSLEGSRKAEVRRGCLRALGACGGASELEFLRRYLAGGRPSELPEVRGAAERIVRRCSAEELANFATQPESPLAVIAIDWLMQTGDPELLPFWTKILQGEDSSLRVKAVRALGDTGDLRALPVVARWFRHADEELRVAAIQAIGSLNAVSEAPLLLDLVQQESGAGVRLAAVAALARLEGPGSDDRLRPLLRDGDADVRCWLAAKLRESRRSDRGRITRELMLDRDARVRAEAARTLGSVGGPEDAAALLALFKDPDTNIRRAAAAALGKVGKQSHFDALTGLLEDADPVVQTEAAEAIEKIVKRTRGPAAVLARLETHANWWVRHAAAQAAAGVEDLREGREIACRLLGDRHPEVMGAALVSLGRLGSMDDLNLLLPYCGDEITGHVRRSAREGVRETLKRVGPGPRQESLRHDSNYIRRLAIDVVEEMADRPPWECVEKCLSDDDFLVRLSSVKTAGRLAAEEDLERLVTMCDDTRQRPWALASLTLADERLYCRVFPIASPGDAGRVTRELLEAFGEA